MLNGCVHFVCFSLWLFDNNIEYNKIDWLFKLHTWYHNITVSVRTSVKVQFGADTNLMRFVLAEPKLRFGHLIFFFFFLKLPAVFFPALRSFRWLPGVQNVTQPIGGFNGHVTFWTPRRGGEDRRQLHCLTRGKKKKWVWTFLLDFFVF